jgi:hypothetical protein
MAALFDLPNIRFPFGLIVARLQKITSIEASHDDRYQAKR